MKNKAFSLFLMVAILLLGSPVMYAQHEDEHSEQEAAHEYHKHHIALFNGATTSFTHNITAYTLGIDYEFRFSKLFGVGILGEYIFSEPEEIVAGIPVFVHPYKGLKIIAAPLLVYGEEFEEADHESGQVEEYDAKHESEKEATFFFRIGAGYDFHLGKLSLGPEVNFDFGKVQAMSYGVSIGYGF